MSVKIDYDQVAKILKGKSPEYVEGYWAALLPQVGPRFLRAMLAFASGPLTELDRSRLDAFRSDLPPGSLKDSVEVRLLLDLWGPLGFEPSENRCAHTEHCCVDHGCKYGHGNCPVVTQLRRQSYTCEMCIPGRDDWG